MSAIVETMMSELVTEGRDLLSNLVKSEAEAAWNRVVVGRYLLRARTKLPKRGTPTHGWLALLGALEMDQATADRYVKLAEATLDLTERTKDQVPNYAALGLDKREGPQPDPEAPPHGDDDAPIDVDVSDLGDSEVAEEIEIDRDTWCTPKWATDALGRWDLDPCANERSHVDTVTAFHLEDDQDGLKLAPTVGHDWRVFINPPYSDVMPWVKAYAHVRFCYLLKFDPSTKWFAELISHTGLVLIPKGTRIQFEAPPGVPKNKSEANQFPHAFFFARAEDAPQALLDRCYVWRVESAA